jgi:predicted PurR-regulated permease PerM
VAIVGTIIGLIVATRIFVAAHRPLSWALAAVVAAVLLDPVVDRLSRHIRRAPAVALTFLALAAISVGTAYLVFGDVEHALDQLQVSAPEAAAQIEDRTDGLGELARDGRLVQRVDSFVAVLEERVTGGDEVLRTTAGSGPSYFVGAILTIFLMTFGPRMAAGALAQDPDEARRNRVAAVSGPAISHARRAIVLTSGVALLQGLVVTAIAQELELPAPAALGFAIAVLALLPHVGLIVGSVPFLLLTLGLRSATAGLLLAVAVVVVQALDSMYVRPWIAHRSVQVGLFVPWVVALLGYAVYGIGGAAYAVLVSVLGLAVLDGLQQANEVRVGGVPAADATDAEGPATASG